MQIQPNNQVATVAGAIRQAARTTGANFDYLLTTAQIESNLNPRARAATSSAEGLFQFIDQTWFATMKTAGPALGLSRYADSIVQGADGRFDVANPVMKHEIMKLRSDPKVSAMLAGAFSRSNTVQLTHELGRPPSEGELYVAHFMGAEGAVRLIGAAISRPHAAAADVFPSAARANRPIFYDRSGNPRSVLGVYQFLTDRYEVARASSEGKAIDPAQAQIALRGTLTPEQPIRPPAPVPTVLPADPPARMPVQDTAAVARAFADANVRPRVVEEAKPLFQAMFHSRGDQPVAPVVRDLWTPVRGQAPVQTVNSFNLFTDTPQPSGSAATAKLRR
ncbi:MAG: lytic transglycosylase domain-containing protein [Pseudolabrys sp.]